MITEFLRQTLKVHPPLLLFVGLLTAQIHISSAEIIPASRRIDWVLGQTVGVPGGIPNRTTIFTTLNAGATAAQINNAIANCPSNQVVKLGAGAFNLSSTLSLTKSGVTLRGSGTNTILNPSHNDTIIDIGSYSDFDAGVSITSGYAKGATNLTVSSTSGLAVGNMVRLSQVIDQSIMWSTDGDTVRAIAQQVQVKAINGKVVTIWPPLHYGLTPANTPLMHKFGGATTEFCGVEDLVVNGVGRTTVWGLVIANTLGCWVKNVETRKINNYHIYTFYNVFLEFTKVFINDSPDYEPNHGGILLGNGAGYSSSSVAIYDCIFNKVLPGIEVNGGSSGCVIAYNYIRDPRYQTTAQSIGLDMNHGPQCMMNLYEGNIVNQISSDGYFGGSAYDTLLRNWSTGWTETFTNYNSRPLFLAHWTIGYNVIGNVFGITNFTPDIVYETSKDSDFATSSIYMFGYPGTFSYSTTRPPYSVRDKYIALDLNVTNTMILHGNWESKTKTVTWASSIPDRSIPDSLYLTSKPAWFGTLTWPPVEPARGYTNLSFTSIPAGYRYINGIDPPIGPVKPAPPTNLRFAGQ